MLRLLQSIFGLTDDRQTTDRDDNLIELATERVIDGTDPRLRAVSGYGRRLRPAVERAVDHVIGLVDSLPPPVELSRHRFTSDQRLQALFASPDHLTEILQQSPALRECLDNRRGLDPETIHGLLGVQRHERRVLGMALQGGMVRREVAQVVVSFDHHRLMGLHESEQESRWELKKRAFDFLIQMALQNITRQRLGQAEAVRQRDLLQDKLKTLQSARWAMDALLDEGETPAVDAATVEQQIRELESKLAVAGSDPMTLDHYLDAISEILEAAPRHLWMEPLTLRLDRMGIKVEDEGDAEAITLELNELHTSNDRRQIVLPISLPFAEVPEKTDFLAKASRYLQ